MMKKLALVAILLLLLGPTIGLVSVGLLMNPAANAACTTGTSVTVRNVPDSLTVTTRDGETFTLTKTQLTHAATIIQVGSSIDGIDRDGLHIALMAALTESTLQQLENPSTYPEPRHYPHEDAVGD